jgi:hypothetical protein
VYSGLAANIGLAFELAAGGDMTNIRSIRSVVHSLLVVVLSVLGSSVALSVATALTPNTASATTICEQGASTLGGGSLSCNLYAGIGANYGPQTNAADTQTDLSGSASTLAGDAGQSVTLGATWADTSQGYGVPGSCGNVNIPATLLPYVVHTDHDVIDCGYWILGESGQTTQGPFYGTFVVNDLVDWWNNPGDAAWAQPYDNNSDTYQCTSGAGSCADPELIIESAPGPGPSGQLCNQALYNGVIANLWCSGAGVYDTSGTWTPSSAINKGCPGGYTSFANPNWCQQFQTQTAPVSSGNATLVLQTDGNLVLYDGTPGSAGVSAVWSTLTMGSHCTLPEAGGVFCIPVSSTLGTQYSTAAGQACNTLPSSPIITPGVCERMAWFYATDTNGTGPGSAAATCSANVQSYFQNNHANSSGAPPPGCQVQLGPQITSAANQSLNLSLGSLTTGEGLYAAVVVYEWDAAGGYNGDGGSFEFPITHTDTGLVQVSSTPPAPPSGGGQSAIACYNGSAWVHTSCTAQVGTYINTLGFMTPLPAYYPSGAGFTVGSTPPVSGGIVYSWAPYYNCNPGYSCGVAVAVSAAGTVTGPGGGGGGIYATITSYLYPGYWPYDSLPFGAMEELPQNTAGIGCTAPNGAVTVYPGPSVTCYYSSSTPGYDTFDGWYVVYPGANYPTAGPLPGAGTFLYDYTTGSALEGSPSTTWAAPAPVYSPNADGYDSLCESGAAFCIIDTQYPSGLPITNSTPGTYTVRAHYLWAGAGDTYAGYPGEPLASLTLTFTPPPPTHNYVPTTTTVLVQPNPDYVDQPWGYTLTSTTVDNNGQPVPAGAGSVEFTWAGGSCSGGTVNSAGQATCTEPDGTFPTGSTFITATFTGTTTGNSSIGYTTYDPSSGYVTETVSPWPTSLQVNVSNNGTTPTVGTPLTFDIDINKATSEPQQGSDYFVMPSAPMTGTVVLTYGGQQLCSVPVTAANNVGGGNIQAQVQCPDITSLPAGPDMVTAVYTSNTSTFLGSSGTDTVVVYTPTTTTITSTPNPSWINQPVTITTTTVDNNGQPVPAGSGVVHFIDPGVPNSPFIAGCANVPVGAQGKATCTTAALPLGTSTVYGWFDSSSTGSAYESSSASTSQTVNTANLSLSATPTQTPVNTSATITATGSGGPIPATGCSVSYTATPQYSADDRYSSWPAPTFTYTTQTESSGGATPTWTASYSLSGLNAGEPSDTVQFNASLVCGGWTVTQAPPITVTFTPEAAASGINHPT